MEISIISLAYKGSITEAISESKRQKKLFVVYISGDNTESVSLEESTWLDSKVEDVIRKYCILLHIRDKSTECTQFSAIYPQRPAPCITAIGYNGIQLWQNEGFLIADVLASSLEKVWLSLHIQETFLSVALTSNKSEPHDTPDSNSLPIEQGSSSSISTPSSDANLVLSSDTNIVLSSDNGIISCSDHAVDDTSSEPTVLKGSSDSNGKVKEEQKQKPLKSQSEASSAPTILSKSSSSNVKEKDQQKLQKENYQAGLSAGKAQAECQTSRENIEVADLQSRARGDTDNNDVKKETLEDTPEVKSTEVHFNIRLPNGTNIQEKFLVEDTLRIVKDYVDGNQASAISSYDLAIPYPRRVFNSHDLSRTLSELGLFGRQALIMVPHIQATDDHKGGFSSEKHNRETMNETNGGSWGVVKNIFSYINPLSYLGGGGGDSSSSSTSGQESQSSNMWQYSPNPSLLHESRQTATSTTTGGATTNNTRNGRTSRIGGNIHTLRHDEDDDTNFSNKNAFWNGNSTQYGGDGDDNTK